MHADLLFSFSVFMFTVVLFNNLDSIWGALVKKKLVIFFFF